MNETKLQRFYTAVKPVWPYLVFIIVFILGVALMMKLAYAEAAPPGEPPGVEAPSPPLLPAEAGPPGDAPDSAEAVMQSPSDIDGLSSFLEDLAGGDGARRLTAEDALVDAAAAGVAAVSPLLYGEDDDARRTAQRVVRRICARAQADAPSIAAQLAAALQTPADVLQGQGVAPTGAGLFAAMADIREAYVRAVSAQRARGWWNLARVFLLARLAEVGTAREVPAILPLVDEADARVGHAAIQTLAALPGEAATRGLVRVTASGYPDRRESALHRLAERNTAPARDALGTLAGQDATEGNWDLIEAAAAVGVPPKSGAGTSMSADDAARLTTLEIRAAGVRERAGDTRHAGAIYARIAEDAGRRHLQRAGLVGLARTDTDRAKSLAVGFLGTSGLRATAMRVLAALPARDEKFLLRAYDEADPSTRAALLYVFAARDSDELPALLAAAEQADHPALRYASADLSDAVAAPEDLYWLSQQGGAWVRDKALRAFLDVAHANAIAGANFEARDQFVAVIVGPYPVPAVAEALDGLAGVAQPEDGELALRFLEHPDLAPAAGRLLAKVIPMQNEPEDAQVALEHLAEVVEGDGVRAAAVDALASMGADTEALVSEAGYVTEWRVLGPLPEDASAPLDQPIVSPRAADAALPYAFAGIDYAWQPVVANGVPATVDLQQVFGPFTSARACMLARINLPGWVPAELLVGASDPCVLWLNGESVHTVPSARPYKADADRIEVKLRPGTNRIYIQALQQGGPWLYGVRITNRRGQPLDLTQARRPDDGLSGVGVQPGSSSLLGDSLP